MKRLLSLVLSVSVLLAVAAPAAAQPNQRAIQTALVGVVAQVALNNVSVLNDSTVQVITVDINDSLNNLLQNAVINVNVLNDSLNNIAILNGVNIDIQDITVVGDDLVITLNLLGDTLVLS